MFLWYLHMPGDVRADVLASLQWKAESLQRSNRFRFLDILYCEETFHDHPQSDF